MKITFGLLVTSFFSLCFLTTGALARDTNHQRNLNPKVSFKLSADGSVRVIGSDLCEADIFKIRVTDDIIDEKSWYTSHAGNTSWKIGQQSCAVNMEVAQDLLQPGKTIEVRTYKNSTGEKVDTFQYNIPCTETEVISVLTDGFDIFIGSVSMNSCQASLPSPKKESSPRALPTPPPKPVQSCTSRVEKSANQIQVSYRCDLPDDVDVKVTESMTGEVVCLERFKSAVSGYRPLSCNIGRNSFKTMKLNVQIDSRKGLFSKNHMVEKEATFTTAPMAQLLNSLKINVTPSYGIIFKEDKTWKTTIKAQVFDADVSREENKYLIKVELVQKVNGRLYLIGQSNVYNTGDVATFVLKTTYSSPGLFTSGGMGGDKLSLGNNQLYLRIHDAYNLNEMAFIDYPVTVNLQ